LFIRKADNLPIDTKGINKILLVRVNYRIGNILFTTPLLNALRKQFPNAMMVSSSKKRGTQKVIKVIYDILLEDPDED